MNRAERRAAASTRASREAASGEARRVALLNAHVNDALDAWSAHVEETRSTDAIVMIVDRGRAAPDVTIATQAVALAFLLRRPAPPAVISKVRAPLPDPQVRAVVVAGGIDVFEVPVV